MKQLFIGLVAIVFSLSVMTGVASANEGTINLSGTDVACEGVSLWKERNYRVSGRCEGLVYPYATQQEHYVLWAKTDERGEVVRVSEIERGYFDGNVGDSYTSLYVTAETDGLPRKPSSLQVASGVVSKFAFDKSSDAAVVAATPAPLAVTETGTTESMTVQSGESTTSTSTSAVGSVIGKILRSLLVIIAVVVVLVIGTSLVFRRRGSVST